jgi:hypothetical protein
MIILIILGSIAVAAIIIYIIWYYNKKRSTDLKLLAESMNFTYSQKGDKSLMDSLSEFHLFSQGYSRRISNVLTGKFNLIPVTVVDYKFTTGGGKSSHTWYQTVLVIESDKLQLPRFVLRPENIFDKIGSIFGKKDINFETAPVFSKRYLLRGDNEEAIRSLFNARVLEYFKQHLGVSAEGDRVKLIYYRTSKRVSPDKIQGFLQEGYDVFTLLKIR